MTHFYTKIIEIDTLIAELHTLDLSDEEKHHLASLADSSLHHAILDEILSNLSPSDKKAFIHHLKENPEDPEIMDFLNEKIDGVEEKISKVSKDLIEELHKDIKEAKKIK
jgi:hypothetical protein